MNLFGFASVDTRNLPPSQNNGHDCATCKHQDEPINIGICKECVIARGYQNYEGVNFGGEVKEE